MQYIVVAIVTFVVITRPLVMELKVGVMPFCSLYSRQELGSE